MYKSKIIIDLDNTITIDSKEKGYPDKELNSKVLEAINEAKKEYDLIVFTARNMLSLNGDINEINKITKPIAEKWLKGKSVPYDKLILGKPYCGKAGAYVDDKNMAIDEFIFRFSSPFKNKTIDVIIPFYNEKENILKVYNDVKRLERIFNIKNFLFVDNGSSDGSNIIFDNLRDRDDKLKVLKVKQNIGYGHGIKTGLNESLADFSLINHSDCQFDTFSYFLNHLSVIENLPEPSSIFSYRLNRSFTEKINTSVLRLFLSIISFKFIKEFNGQPKLIDNGKIKGYIDQLPDNFSLDYSLLSVLKPKYFFPVIQKNRISGVSSWSGSIIKRLKIFLTYLIEASKKHENIPS